MTEVFNSLSIVGDPISEEDQVVYLLASIPESYSMLVTALEASTGCMYCLLLLFIHWCISFIIQFVFGC